MKGLATQQRSFQRHVDRPRRTMERAVLATPGASAARRLGVYVDAYRLRLVEALGSDYPALRGLLGDTRFDRAMREFIAARPSRHRNLRWYGRDLAGFLARSPHWGRRPLLAELAQFEWALGLAFDAKDAATATVDEVASVPAADWPEMRLRLDPSVLLLSLHSNAPQVWTAASAGRKAPATVMRKQATGWLVWRKGDAPYYRDLTVEEFRALGAVAKGRSFGQLCEGMGRHVGKAQAAMRAAQLLKCWLSEGLISAVRGAPFVRRPGVRSCINA